MMLDALNATQIAMEMDQLKMQSITHNISNINTPGFKKQILDNPSFAQMIEPKTSLLMQQLKTISQNIQGTFTQTNHAADLAISGEGYFQVQNDQGLFYTRRGDFKINAMGELTTATGELVLGKGGVIKLDDQDFNINTQGEILVEHHKIEQLQIVQFKETQALEYMGNGLYQTQESPTPCDHHTQVLQGMLEQSNVKSIDEMMDLVKTSRHFEASQRILKVSDSMLSTAINQLGEGNV